MKDTVVPVDALNTYRGERVISPLILNPSTRRVRGKVYAPAALTWERVLDTHKVGGWMRPRTGVDALEKRQIPFSCQELNHSSSDNQPLT